MKSVLVLLVLCVVENSFETTLLSYNVGLTRTIPKYTDRRRTLLESLKKEKADVICLQEVWNGFDLDRLTDELADHFEYSYSSLHIQGAKTRPGSACKKSDIRLMACIGDKECFKRSSFANFIKCLEDECNLYSYRQSCISCIILSVEKLEVIAEDCYEPKFDFNTNGLLLLSKKPIFNAFVKKYFPRRKQLVPRALLKARIAGIGHVICTDLSVNIVDTYLENLPFSSWQEQNYAEVKKLVRFANRFKNKKQHVVIMGTMNTGPEIPSNSVSEAYGDSYQALKDAGYRSYYAQTIGLCTRCTDNPLLGEYYTTNTIADHIFTEGCKVKSARRRFVEYISGKNYPLSYLYGVEITI